MSSAKRIILAVAAMLAAMLGVSACDPGPECIKDHTEITYQTMIGPDGNVSMQPVYVDVCDEYAKESPKP